MVQVTGSVCDGSECTAWRCRRLAGGGESDLVTALVEILVRDKMPDDGVFEQTKGQNWRLRRVFVHRMRDV